MFDWAWFDSKFTPAQIEGIFAFLAGLKQQREANGGAFYMPPRNDLDAWSSTLRGCDTGGVNIQTVINIVYDVNHKAEQEGLILRYGLT
ncbi:hypothetical protein QFC20_007687 [Naganishia adeliensis]|uniref:Uncharacterized protein n=1 Tax=Naganishia adeliensis TaxID=92952 RepID=A0ACC2UWB2_9TREE|nr:hypothetical protein QFC20_007687 [Naganishia adeliensis]